MKNLKLQLLLSLAAALLLSACSGSSEPEEQIEQIKLSNQDLWLGAYGNTGKISILSGNEGYFLVYPVYIDYYYYEKDTPILTRVHYADYNEKILSLHIDEENNIVIERKGIFDQYISALFMVKDSKEASRLFSVSYTPSNLQWNGLTPYSDIDMLFGDLVDNKEYWVYY